MEEMIQVQFRHTHIGGGKGRTNTYKSPRVTKEVQRKRKQIKSAYVLWACKYQWEPGWLQKDHEKEKLNMWDKEGVWEKINWQPPK